jgi:hypothetical protein
MLMCRFHAEQGGPVLQSQFLGRLRQENHEFEVTLNYTVRLYFKTKTNKSVQISKLK